MPLVKYMLLHAGDRKPFLKAFFSPKTEIKNKTFQNVRYKITLKKYPQIAGFKW